MKRTFQLFPHIPKQKAFEALHPPNLKGSFQGKVFCIGFDGYSKKDQLISKKDLYVENQEILSVYKNKIEITSLTPTLYSDLKKSSIYVQ